MLTILPTLDIVKYDDTVPGGVLRRRSVDVIDFNIEVRELALAMVETMFEANGVGLAAPQVGHNRNLFVMRTEQGLNLDNREAQVIFNPFVLNMSADTVMGVEGCLSIPGVIGKVARAIDLQFAYTDIDGNRKVEGLTGFHARIFQHEFDHLVGTLFIDRAVALART